MVFLTKIKKGIKHPLLRKIVILLIIVTLSYLIFRKYKLKEGMDSNNLANIIQIVGGGGGTIIEIDDFIEGQNKKKNQKFKNTDRSDQINRIMKKRIRLLSRWRNNVMNAADRAFPSNSSVFVIPPIIVQELSKPAVFVNPLDNIVDGISLIESKGGVFVNTDTSCSDIKRIKYISKKLKLEGKRPNICDSNLFIVFTVKSNSLTASSGSKIIVSDSWERAQVVPSSPDGP